jgi:hypothetical protein
MATGPTMQEIVDEVADALSNWVQETPKKQRRLLSKTFWGYFGYKRRSRELIALVKEALVRNSLFINLGDELFGGEEKEEWLVLTYVTQPGPPAILATEPIKEAAPMPADDWFTQIETCTFESEREVEYYFVLPILEQLGYTEEDTAIGYSVLVYEGAKRTKKEADFALFDGSSRDKEHALLVVEAKGATSRLSEDTIGQARSYAIWLTTPYYVVTNGEEIRVYWLRGAIQADLQVMIFNRRDFRQHWPGLYRKLNRAAVIAYKDELSKVFDTMHREE